jgi:ABC-type uncharacterized transport system permease subunit
MSISVIASLAALAMLVPAAVSPVGDTSDRRYWIVLALAVAGPTIWVGLRLVGPWQTGISGALWLAIAVSVAVFAVTAVIAPVARRLTSLLAIYLWVLGALATLWLDEPSRPMTGHAPSAWLGAHIVVSLLAYGLLTLAAVAGAAVALQERALKRKQPTALTRRLPSMAEGERLQTGLLAASAAVLAVALVTGMTINWLESRSLLHLDHKTVLSVLAFVVIVALLMMHRRGGLSGRRAARFILVAYLLLTLAYPGVKLVTDILIG